MGLPGAERTTKRSEEAEPGGIKSSADEQTARAERIEKRSENAEPEGINLIRADGMERAGTTQRLPSTECIRTRREKAEPERINSLIQSRG